MSEENEATTPELNEATAGETDAEQQPSPQLALNDLTAAIQIIDVAASRGAFRGEELSQVGGVRDRLSLFLNANMPPKEEHPDENEAENEVYGDVSDTSDDPA